MNPAQLSEALAKLQALKEAKAKPAASAPQLQQPKSLPNLSALLAAKKSQGEARSVLTDNQTTPELQNNQISQTTINPQTEQSPSQITYNEKQSQFISLASAQSCVLIGAAGTGKTTATGGLIKI